MANQAYIKDMNVRRVLTLLRLEGLLSRADIARRVALTKSTVTYIVDELISQGLVSETERSVSPSVTKELGRPGISVGLEATGGYFLGVEIGVSVLRFALLDLTLKAVHVKATKLAKPLTPQTVVNRIADHLASLRGTSLYADRIQAIGVTVPGLVRSDGFVLHLPILGWRDVNFLQLTATRLDLPVNIENNANAAAFGEVYCSPRHASGLSLYLKLGNGCGGAAIINGELLRGSSGSATEFGHMRVADNGPQCGCGRFGCLEPHVNLAGLSRYARECRFQGSDDPLSIATAAREGNRQARAAIDRLLHFLSIGLINLSNIFNPSDIVLGGALLPVLEFGLETLRMGLAEGIVEGMRVPSLELSKRGEYECAIGAAALAHQRAYDIGGMKTSAAA
jgi:N-acetylglucosamine repressor